MVNSELNATFEIICSQLSAVKARKEMILFINDRLVESESIRRGIDRAY